MTPASRPPQRGFANAATEAPRAAPELAGIDCQHTLPQVKAWHDRYKDKGLVVVGVHTPE